MKYRWSGFCVEVPLGNDNLLLKNTLTGAAVCINLELKNQINTNLLDARNLPSELEELAQPEIALLIPEGFDEYAAWRHRLVDRRNNEAHIFILHFLPTIQCQFECDYCFENGADRGVGMPNPIIDKSQEWLDGYFGEHPEIDTFRLVIFGGEPLLRKDLVRRGLEAFHSIAQKHNLEFWCELTSNGELLDESTAAFLSKHEWKRVQITLDGPEELHDTRRHGHNLRPTFANIMWNVKMLLASNYIPRIDIRISFDSQTADRAPELIRYLAEVDVERRINLSLGMITSTFQKETLVVIGNVQHQQGQPKTERIMAEKALAIWQVAKEYGFRIPEEFITGPWCVAIAKHSAVLQPDGSLQKCFCTAGRSEYNFGTIAESAGEYLKDTRFEHFRRTDQCIEEKCEFLPMCGGGCIHDAVVANGGPEGFDERFCQKTLLAEMNAGLLKLNYL